MGIKHSRPVPPFMRYCSAIIPTMFDDSLSYYEALCALNRFIQTNIVEVINNNASVTQEYIQLVDELKDYVEHYFDNLDVQEEINNKLDQMVEDGTLQEIISSYLNANAIWGFNSVSDMLSATNLLDGSYAKTLGYYNTNDGGEGLYKIRNKEVSDVVDNSLIYELTSDNTLVAELVYSKKLNVKSLGCKADKSADCSVILQNAIDKLDNITLFFSHGAYKCDTAINMKAGINLKGEFKTTYTGLSDEGLFFDGTSGIIGCSNNTIDGMLIQNETYDDTASNIGIAISGGTNTRISNTTIVRFKNGIGCSYHVCIADNVYLHENGNGVTNPVDSRFTNCTVNANERSGFSLQAGANDNIISNCKIEWNKGYGITTLGAAYNNVIEGNVIDRNSQAGIYMSSGSSNTLVTSNVLRRNGAEMTGVTSANIYLNNCPGVIVSNNTTATGNSRDDGTGVIIPEYSLYAVDFANSKLMLIGNRLNGGNNANPVHLVRTTNVTRIDADTPVYDSLRIKFNNYNVEANGGTRDYIIPYDTIPAQYSQGVYRKLVITTRTSSDTGYSIKEVYAMLYRQYGTLKVAFSDDTIKENLLLSGSYDETNGVTVTVTNNTSAGYQVQINSYAS